jgi:hypothetical protein
MGDISVWTILSLNPLEDNINTMKKNTDVRIVASMEVGVEVNTEKTRYMLISHHQNAEQIHNRNIENRSFGNVTKIKYLGSGVTNQNLIQEEMKRILKSGNACYHSVQNLVPSHLLSIKVKKVKLSL